MFSAELAAPSNPRTEPKVIALAHCVDSIVNFRLRSRDSESSLLHPNRHAFEIAATSLTRRIPLHFVFDLQ
jgi:hypothetical protein